MKRFLKILIVIVIIAGLIYGGYYIVKNYVLNSEKAKEYTVVFTDVNIEGVNTSKEEIYKMIQIDNGEYLLVTKDKLFDENYEPIEGAKHNSYHIYRYNGQTVNEEQRVDVGQYFEIVCIDKEKSELYIRLFAQGATDGENDDIVLVNYNAMEREELSKIAQSSEALSISNDGQVWSYLRDNNIYISGKNFANGILVLEGSANEVYLRPYGMVGDSVIYESYSHIYPEKNGIGVINASKSKNIFINVEQPNYLGYNEQTNEIYYTQKSTNDKIKAVNVDTQKTRDVISLTTEVDEFVSNYYISPDFKYIAYIGYLDQIGMTKASLKVYDMTSKEVVFIYDFENIDNITDVIFENDNVYVVQNGKFSKIDVIIEEEE